MTSTLEVLREFNSGGDWQSYAEQLECYFVANRVPENKKVPILLALVSPTVYKILRDLCHPELVQLKTYTHLSNLLENLSSQEASVFGKRVAFYEATQNHTEDAYQWFSRVTSLAVSCEFGNRLDILLRDRFVSGLADQRMISRLSKENGIATLGQVVDSPTRIEVEVETRGWEKLLAAVQHLSQAKDKISKKVNILNFSDEILIRIILHLNPIERVPLGNSCRKFKTLVFEDEQVLGNLNLSEYGALTSGSDIHQYFNNEVACKHIHSVEIGDVECIKSIGKAINLVNISIAGTVEFTDIWQLVSLLSPLAHLRVLRIRWNISHQGSSRLPRPLVDLLEKPFNRLTSLTVWIISINFDHFLDVVQLCDALQTLIIQSGAYSGTGDNKLKKLKNLEILRYYGSYDTIGIEQRLVTMLPDPDKWMDFQMDRFRTASNGFYFEKNVEVCEELRQSNLMRIGPDFQYVPSSVGYHLFPNVLLNEILEITHENVPSDLCCLPMSTNGNSCVMRINDAKNLLKNPKHQISFLFLQHDIERGCDIHLIASAFPNLTELVLHGRISKNRNPTNNTPHSLRRLIKKGFPIVEEEDDSWDRYSSFKMLVKNTPQMRHFTIRPQNYDNENVRDSCGELVPDWEWDLDALYLIADWKELRTLRLRSIPIKNGGFLDVVGKFCKNLEELELLNCPHIMSSLITSVENLVYACSKLTTLLFANSQNMKTKVLWDGGASEQLQKAFQRLTELNRSNLRIRMYEMGVKTLCEKTSGPIPFLYLQTSQ